MTHEANDVQNNSQVWWKRLGNPGSLCWSQAAFGKIPQGRERLKKHSQFASWEEKESRQAGMQGLMGLRGHLLIPEGRSESGQCGKDNTEVWASLR